MTEKKSNNIYRKFMYIIMILGLCLSCTKDDDLSNSGKGALTRKNADSTNLNDVLLRDTLRILDIGNSYTEDVTAMLDLVLNSYGSSPRDMCYYTLIRGNASFKTWYDCYLDKDNNEYSIKKVTGEFPVKLKTGKYGAYNGQGLRDALNTKWDIILIHQASTYSANYDIWFMNGEAGCLKELVELIEEKQPQATLGFYLIHSYSNSYNYNTEKSSYDRWVKYMTATKRLLNDFPQFKILIPYGTAIQNLRAMLPDEEMDHTRDGTHLGIGLARYTATCCLVQTLFAERYGITIPGSSMTYKCPMAMHVKYSNGCTDVTSANAPIAQQAACMAVSTPFEMSYITQ